MQTNLFIAWAEVSEEQVNSNSTRDVKSSAALLILFAFAFLFGEGLRKKAASCIIITY